MKNEGLDGEEHRRTQSRLLGLGVAPCCRSNGWKGRGLGSKPREYKREQGQEEMRGAGPYM